jgi:DtxR family transcriptional regulator, Mn-dependent transcriptional regulator
VEAVKRFQRGRAAGDSHPRRLSTPVRLISSSCALDPYDGRVADYHPAVEEYLETILELEESGIPPMRARIVERLKVSAPAVSETVRRLEREGYVRLTPSRQIALTTKGRHYATSILRRHRLAERLLTDVIKIPWSEVHEEAGRLEHAISPSLEAHLIRLLGDPATCPHGNPIPGSANAADPGPLEPIVRLLAGGRGIVRRIDEELEARFERMQALEEAGLIPGSEVTLVSVDAKEAQLSTTKGASTLPRDVVDKVFVEMLTRGSIGSVDVTERAKTSARA